MNMTQRIKSLDISEHAIEMMIDKAIENITTRVKSSSLQEQLQFLDDNYIDDGNIIEWLDIETVYYEKITKQIRSINSNADISDRFLIDAYVDDISPAIAVESFYNDMSIEVEELKGLKGSCDSFHEEVRKLSRPYIAISDGCYKFLMNQKHEYYLTSGGTVVTFGYGTVAGGSSQYALMPLNAEESAKIKAENNQC
jgi:hypothetical protein